MERKSREIGGARSKDIVPILALQSISRKRAVLFALLLLHIAPISGAFFFPSVHSSTRCLSRCYQSPKRVNSLSPILRSSCTNNDDDFNSRVPRHVAFICDGNSRWAQKRRLPTAVGHLIGADRFINLMDYLQADGVQYCTFFGFSTENWKRSENEIRSIFELMEQTARKLSHHFPPETSNVKFRLLGDVDDDRIPEGLRNALRKLEETNGNSRHEKLIESNVSPTPLIINLAINYGGRQDILRATKLLALAVKDGTVESPDDITEEVFASFLNTAGTPDPDMIIRTSGESRLSNFLLWNCAYSEIYISPAMWPEFDRDCWQAALAWYQQRERRFGSRKSLTIQK